MSGLLTDLAKVVLDVLVEDVGRPALARYLEAHNSSTTTTDAVVVDEDSDDDETAAAGGEEKKAKDVAMTAAAGGVEKKAKDVAMRVGMEAGLSLLHWGATKLIFGSSSSSEPLMNAPGKPPIKTKRSSSSKPPMNSPGKPPIKPNRSSSSSKPLMNAPGKPSIKINRRDFEANPAGYFRKVRAEKKLANQLISGISSTTK